ncbi:hypothetical protein NFHSH190041_31990 [Shewanella sp. NFH-SH190041]|uniref:type II secretion system protein n=1 Tax=Shewanella sp. NFH-SH190041 TaxID=2950245 RepID=UPI0021FF00F7|nr:type II secretion system protein [Shewanella sp. NFH-SH190041]BDM65747.1 hypothetical protein NFHSH190041_31990 [Shewanella sp. NFH-SH190041]
MRPSPSKGFTLIELVVVIIILGILAVVAVPRFVDIKSDAYAATLRGVEASIKSVTQMTLAKAKLKAPESLFSGGFNIDIDDNGVVDQLVFGKPRAQGDGIYQLVDIDAKWFANGQMNANSVCDPAGQEFCAAYIGSVTQAGVTPTPAHFVVYLPQGKKVADNCFAYYFQATGSDGQPVTGYTRSTALQGGAVVSGC